MHHVIIGNGIAGMTAANELRRLDANASISLVSNESDHFFSRTALMYEFCGQLSRKDIEPHPRDHYERMNFHRVRETVLGVDFDARQLQFENQKLSYDTLLIASGSVPSRAPWQPEGITGIGHFVTLQDLEWLKESAASSQQKRAAVVGGGLIGIETVEILLLAGFSVDFIIREEWYWPVALNQAESGFIAEHMREHGCSVILETEVARVLSRDGALTGITLSNGEDRPLDLMVVSIGVTPNTAFLKDTEIALSTEGRHRGVEVNELLETSVPGVFAAGDCATVSWFDGARHPEQLWYTGRDQGLVAAKNMAGQKREYRRGPLYNSAKFFDIEYTTAGLVNFNLPGLSEWYQKNPDLPVSQRIVLQDDRVIGFNMIGSRWDHRVLIRWIEERRPLSFVLDNLREAQFDSEFSPSFKILPQAHQYTL